MRDSCSSLHPPPIKTAKAFPFRYITFGDYIPNQYPYKVLRTRLFERRSKDLFILPIFSKYAFSSSPYFHEQPTTRSGEHNLGILDPLLVIRLSNDTKNVDAHFGKYVSSHIVEIVNWPFCIPAEES